MFKRKGLIAAALAATTFIAGCSSESTTDAASEDSTAAATSETTSAEATTAAETSTGAAQADSLVLEEGYCKAKLSAEEIGDEGMPDMTACFGMLNNEGDEDIRVVAFNIPALESDTIFELHEVVDGVMQEREQGFDIVAGGSVELAPGGNHFMIMNHPAAILPGEVLEAEITLEDDSVVTVEIPVRDQPSGEEDYGHGHHNHDHGHEHHNH